MEWEFLRFDPAFRRLSSDSIRLAYLSLWALCVHLRRDTFRPKELYEGYLPDMCGVSDSIVNSPNSIAKVGPSWMEGFVGECLAVGLLKKGPRGSIRVRGVKSKHDKLRGWNEGTIAAPIAAPLRPIIPLTGTVTVTGTETVIGQGEENTILPQSEADAAGNGRLIGGKLHQALLAAWCEEHQALRQLPYKPSGADLKELKSLRAHMESHPQDFPDPVDIMRRHARVLLTDTWAADHHQATLIRLAAHFEQFAPKPAFDPRRIAIQ